MNKAELDAIKVSLESQHLLESSPHRTWPELYGAVRDVHRMADALPKFGFTQIDTSLTDEQATREAILLRLRTVFIKEALDGDVLLFYFSGHGSQMTNSLSATKADDHRDETIVPWDANAGVFDIRDKELSQLFNQAMAAHHVNIIAIFDSCHSGTMARDLGSSKLHPKDVLPDSRDAHDAYGAKPDEAPPETHGALILTAAGKDQVAMEAYDDASSNPQDMDGAYTLALLKALDEVTPQTSAQQVEAVIEKNLHDFEMREDQRQTEPKVPYNQKAAIAGTKERLQQSLFLAPSPKP